MKNNMTMNNDDKDDAKVELKYNTKDILQAAAVATLDDPYTRSSKAPTIPTVYSYTKPTILLVCTFVQYLH